MSRFTLNDEARAYLAENARRNPVPAPQLTLAEARAAAVDLAWRQSAPVPVAAVRDTFAVGPAGYVPLRIHDPGPAPRRARREPRAPRARMPRIRLRPLRNRPCAPRSSCCPAEAG
ncbi:hypothetical protein [Brevibacterium sp. CS2]|uniref:hypothetical protein n=1 Tax=Brevibacterium sp. CS2 TaxID=2575923 RepID=UPI0010C7B9FB|nr:hypothetical protein [Brevibacterium sp. CS2]QCP04667.1 hypothetical protein FDF13_04640 [Brevibacterium sp. CS2]